MYAIVYLLPLFVAPLVFCAPDPVPLEEEFNFFNTKQESHEEKFIRSDQNKNKELTFDEFLHMELAYVEAKREEFDSLDKNKDGKITRHEYEEHYHGVNSKSAALKAEYFGKVFEEFDDDLDKTLSQDEMERVLAERFLVKPRENFPTLYYTFDSDHSGGLDINEYMKFDANFPFEQTDPIRPAGRKPLPPPPGTKKDSPVQPAHGGGISADDAAIRAVLAQSGVRSHIRKARSYRLL